VALLAAVLIFSAGTFVGYLLAAVLAANDRRC
jgi:hypothetical protein